MAEFKITRNTPTIKRHIVAALKANNKPATTANVGSVWHAYMDQCGMVTDMCDALAAAFGGTLEDYDYEPGPV